MNKLLCTMAALVIGSMAGGCSLYFGGGGGGDDICAGAGGDYALLRDPQNGACESAYGGGGCGAPTPVAQPDWAMCDGACEALDETSCLATSGCRAAYLEDFSNCPPGADCPVSYQFWGCWETAPSGPIQGQCSGLDAQGCSEHDDCEAVYQTVYNSDGTTSTSFSYCEQEPGSTGCYSDADCQAGYTCDTSVCNPPPGCDPNNGQPCPAVCYGQCVPAQNGCDTVDCAPGTHCELACTDTPCKTPACGQTCSATCVPDPGTCADGSVCPPGSHCDTICTPPDPSCQGGPMGCPQTCTSTCTPDVPPDPGSCTGQILCDIAAPACPDGTTPGIANGCYTGYCIPLADCGPNDPGQCTGDVTCNSAPPGCPPDTTAGIANGCYTGYCIPLSSCNTPPPACEGLDEASCSARTDCTPIYSGMGCTCYPDGTCTCGTWTFDHCQSNVVIDPPPPTPTPL